MSCVRPGVLLTNARRRRPASVLIALDLPAFERPANAISGAAGPGSSRGSCTDITYAACASGRSARGLAERLATPSRATVKSLSFGVAIFPSRGLLMRVLTGFAGFIWLVYAGAVASAEPAAAAKPDLERGKQIGTTVCAACHGPDGNSA